MSVSAKYYYSKETAIKRLPVVVDENGEVLYVCSHMEAKTKKLPRVTVATLYNRDANEMSFAVSVCANKDQFIKRIGRELAHKRAETEPELIVRGIKRNKVSATSKRYAQELIDKYLEKYV